MVPVPLETGSPSIRLVRSCALKAACALLAVLVGGCASLDAARFKKSEYSGVEENKVALVLFSSTQSESEVPPELVPILKDPKLSGIVAENCLDKGKAAAPPLAPALVPIASALGQLAFDLYLDHLKQRIQDIVDSAQVTYGVTAAATPKNLVDATCALVVRYTMDESNVAVPGLVALSKLEEVLPPPDADTKVVRLQPVYVQARNAAAVTREAAEPTIGISLALSVKATARQQSQLVRLLPSGEGVVTIPKVAIGPGASVKCQDKTCKRSDLIPYPKNKGALSITVSVTEQGTTGFDDKAATAELAAIKDALGPAIGEAIKARLD